jgi:hypothetical protein
MQGASSDLKKGLAALIPRKPGTRGNRSGELRETDGFTVSRSFSTTELCTYRVLGTFQARFELLDKVMCSLWHVIKYTKFKQRRISRGLSKL